MAELGLDQTQARGGSADLVRSVLAGAVAGSVCFAITVALAAAVFSGPLKPALGQGLSMILFGGIVFALAGIVFGRTIGAQYQTQSVTGVIAALAVERIASDLPDAPIEVLFASAAAFVVLSTALTGLIFVLAGAARLGHAARFIPYPVLGGFVAATGLFLVARAITIAAPGAVDLSSAVGTLGVWGPPIALGALLVLIERTTGLRYLLLWGIGFVALVAHLGTLVLSGDVTASLTFLDGIQAGLVAPDLFVWDQLGAADFDTAFGQLPLAFALAGLALVAALVNVSALELEGQQSIDLNKQMVRAGGTNLIASLGGGLTGFQSLALTRVAEGAGGSKGWPIAITSTVVFVSAALLGPMFMTAIPVAAMALVLAYVGADLMYRWLLIERGRLSPEENAVVLIILGSSVVFGFVVALGVGVVAASMLFTVSYSRLNVVRAEYSGSLGRSATERSEADEGLLSRYGRQTTIMELQGFLFFGTANTIVDRVETSITGSETRVRNLVLDFSRVQAMDASAVSSMQKLHVLTQRRNMELYLTGMRETVSKPMQWCENATGISAFETLQEALSNIEDRVLSEFDPGPGYAEASDFAKLVAEIENLGRIDLLPLRSLTAGEVLFSTGSVADSLVFIEAGRLSAFVNGPNGETRVATFLEGAVVGELGFYGDMPRTADIVADRDALVRMIPRASIETLETEAPEVAARIHALLARLMSRRLARTTALLFAIGRGR